MRFLLLFSAVIATSLGFRWDDFRGGDVKLPNKQKNAEDAQWRFVEKDEELEISWFAHSDNDDLLVAYDKLGNCAGVRFSTSKDDIDEDFLHLYSSNNLFEEKEVFGKKSFVSTVLFTDERILKHGGREMLDTEEVALGCYLKGGSSYKMLARDGCRQIKSPFYEQGCQNGYGVVLSSFEGESKCDSLSPFYTVYEPEDRGNLMGFGWLVIGKTPKTSVFCKAPSAASIEALFKKASSCLTSYEGVTTVEVWLAYSDSLKTSCPDEGSWAKSHCKHRSGLRPDKEKKEKKGDDSSSSSESSDSSSGSGEKGSWWHKLWDKIAHHNK